MVHMAAAFTELRMEYMNMIQTNGMEGKCFVCVVVYVLPTLRAIGVVRVSKLCNI